MFWLLLFALHVQRILALCPCPGTECTNFTNVVTCTAFYFQRGAYNFRVKAHTTDGSNITVRTMPGDKRAPCSTTGTIYSDLSQTTPVECYESSTYYLNTCANNGVSVVINNENAVGDAPTNFIIIQTPVAECPTPAPSAAPSKAPTPEPPSLSPTFSPSAAPSAPPTHAPTSVPLTREELSINAGLVYPLAAIGTIVCVFLVGLFFMWARKRRKRRFNKIGDGGDDVPLREKRESRSHSRSRSKRQSGKFSGEAVVVLEVE